MIIEKIDIEGVALLETEYDPPVAADRDGSKALQIAAQAMQAEAWNIHVVDRDSGIKAAEQEDDLFDEVRPQSPAVVILEQPPQPAMANAADHVPAFVD